MCLSISIYPWKSTPLPPPETSTVLSQIPLAELCPDINLRLHLTLFGLPFRAVGAESLCVDSAGVNRGYVIM